MFAVLMTLVVLALTALILWWFAHPWKPLRKDWCVMFYLTAQIPRSSSLVATPTSETGIPIGTTLDQKLNQVVSTLDGLPCATSAQIAANPVWDNVYVAYRAIWDDIGKDPQARVVRPEASAPTATYFPGETIVDVGLSADLTTDITDFFSWVYDNCPANHYAVFFWGHAMGPGGLFQQSERPIVISPPLLFVLRFARRLLGKNRWSGLVGVTSLRKAFHTVVLRRIADQQRRNVAYVAPHPLPGGAATLPPPPPPSSAPPPPGPPAGVQVPKVEAVLFQDCWMSGIETAFELQDDVRYIIASQSLVPIGLDPTGAPGAVWPYQQLIECMLTNPNFGVAMLGALQAFFDVGGNNRYPMKKVLFSLIDCDTVTGAVSAALKTEFQDLVKALYPIGPDLRSKLIDMPNATAGRLYELSGATLKVGDQALIDILVMCAYLKTPGQWPNSVVTSTTQGQRDAIVAAATALQAKLAGLIIGTFQSPAPVNGDLPYSGITALYKTWAIFGDDQFIEGAYRAPYECFRYAKETFITASSGGNPECSWTQYAFDKDPWP